MKLDSLVTLGIAGALVYAIAKVTGAAGATGRALSSVGSAIGSGLYEFFHPNAAGESLYYTATFPDGSRHAIPSSAVNSSGIFTRESVRYQLLTDKATGARYAVAL